MIINTQKPFLWEIHESIRDSIEQGMSIRQATDRTKSELSAYLNSCVPNRPQVLHKVHSNSALRMALTDTDLQIGEIDVSEITDFSGVFDGCQRNDWNQLALWDIQIVSNSAGKSRIIQMDAMFRNSNIDDTARFGNWLNPKLTAAYMVLHNIESISDVWAHWTHDPSFLVYRSKVPFITAHGMFEGCKSFTGVGTGIENWDMSCLTQANYMFAGCSKFNADISGWNLGKMQELNQLMSMFEGCSEFNQPLTTWCLSGLSTSYFLNDMFKGCSKFNQDIQEIRNKLAITYRPSKRLVHGNYHKAHTLNMFKGTPMEQAFTTKE